jgi:Pyridoxamine 5'-phosphate oxidase
VLPSKQHDERVPDSPRCDRRAGWHASPQMNWVSFASASPELAELGRERFERQRLCMVGTIRRNGWPRVSPCELDLVGDQLLLGMMWQSPKARDLLRDSRCVLHSCTSDRHGTEGDFKLYGRAQDVRDSTRRDAYRAAIKARIDWEPDDPFHLSKSLWNRRATSCSGSNHLRSHGIRAVARDAAPNASNEVPRRPGLVQSAGCRVKNLGWPPGANQSQLLKGFPGS